jgi:hypothetical protein
MTIIPLNNRTAEKMAELDGSVSPRLISMHWCEHWPEPGQPPEAGEFLSYSLELAKAYAKGKWPWVIFTLINRRYWQLRNPIHAVISNPRLWDC